MSAIPDELATAIEAERARPFQARGILDCAAHVLSVHYECGNGRPNVEAALDAAVALIEEAADRLDVVALARIAPRGGIR